MMLHNLLQAHDFAPQITPKIESTSKAIDLICTHAARVRALV